MIIVQPRKAFTRSLNVKHSNEDTPRALPPSGFRSSSLAAKVLFSQPNFHYSRAEVPINSLSSDSSSVGLDRASQHCWLLGGGPSSCINDEWIANCFFLPYLSACAVQNANPRTWSCFSDTMGAVGAMWDVCLDVHPKSIAIFQFYRLLQSYLSLGRCSPIFLDAIVPIRFPDCLSPRWASVILILHDGVDLHLGSLQILQLLCTPYLLIASSRAILNMSLSIEHDHRQGRI